MRKARRVVIVALVLVGLCLFYGYFFWPTPWRTWYAKRTIRNGNHFAHHTYAYRTNRLDGHVEIVLPGILGMIYCYPVAPEELRDGSGEFTAAQLREARRRW